MADNWVKLEKDIDGTNGYGSGGADYEDAAKRAGSGQVLHDARPGQIQFLEGLIAQTKDPQVKVRIRMGVPARPRAAQNDRRHALDLPEAGGDPIAQLRNRRRHQAASTHGAW